MRLLSLAIGLWGAVALSNVCCAQDFDNPFSQYVERGVTIEPGSGNAKDANAAIHTIDPWPPYARYTRIPGNGREGVGSVEQMYRIPHPFVGAGAGVGATGTTGAGAGQQGAGASGMQPSSGGY